jgi:hypothetical protein
VDFFGGDGEGSARRMANITPGMFAVHQTWRTVPYHRKGSHRRTRLQAAGETAQRKGPRDVFMAGLKPRPSTGDEGRFGRGIFACGGEGNALGGWATPSQACLPGTMYRVPTTAGAAGLERGVT